MTKSITLYGIDDSILSDKDKGPKVVSVQARECRSTYVIDRHDVVPFLNYRQRIGKHSYIISLSPQEALLKYIGRQSKVMKAGQRAAKRKAKAKELLNDEGK